MGCYLEIAEPYIRLPWSIIHIHTYHPYSRNSWHWTAGEVPWFLCASSVHAFDTFSSQLTFLDSSRTARAIGSPPRLQFLSFRANIFGSSDRRGITYVYCEKDFKFCDGECFLFFLLAFAGRAEGDCCWVVES